MKKILFLMGVLTISLFLIACKPTSEPTDEEIQAELAQLSVQQLEALKEGKQPLAGQAHASILQQTNRQRLFTSINREMASRIRVALKVGAACAYIDRDSTIPPNSPGPFYGGDTACASGFCLNYSIRSFDDSIFAESLFSWGCAVPSTDLPPGSFGPAQVNCCAPMNVPSGGRCFLGSSLIFRNQCASPFRCGPSGICA